MNRRPPGDCIKKLRSEVNFGCPVKGCGNPYLFWHHFDPPWAEKEHHNPEGMIALCSEHHNKADAGAFTKEQLRALKVNGHTKEVAGAFDWMRRDIIANLGGSICIRPKVLLQLGDHNVIWFNRDEEGHYLLNMDIRSGNGDKRISMEDNFWIIHHKPLNLASPPNGRILIVEYQEEKITIEFLNIENENQFYKLYNKHTFADLDIHFPVTAVNLKYVDLKEKLHLDFNKGIFPGNNMIFGGFMEVDIAYAIKY